MVIDIEIIETDKDNEDSRQCHTCGYPLDSDEVIVCVVCQDDERKSWD